MLWQVRSDRGTAWLEHRSLPTERHEVPAWEQEGRASDQHLMLWQVRSDRGTAWLELRSLPTKRHEVLGLGAEANAQAISINRR